MDQAYYRKRWWKPWVLALVLLASAGGVYALSIRFVVDSVDPVRAVIKPYTQHLFATVEVRPQHVYEIGIFRDPGQVIRVHKEVGDWVERGEAVLEIDTTSIEIEALIAEAQKVFHEEMGMLPHELETDRRARIEDLEMLELRAQEGRISRYDLEQAKIEIEKLDNRIAEEIFNREASLRTQTIRARGAVRRIESALIRSSVSGTIVAVNKKVGEFLNIGESAFEVYENGVIEVIAKVSEEDYDKVFEGQRVMVELRAFPGVEYPGVVEKVFPKGNEINQQIDVEISLQNMPKNIIPGLTGLAKFVVQEMGDVLLLPSTAVFLDEVMVIKDGRLERRKVGVRYKGLIHAVIDGGLEEEEVVLREFDTSLRTDRRVWADWSLRRERFTAVSTGL